jgi:hypothetical protein
MMSIGPPSTIDTSMVSLSTQTNDVEILRMIQQYLSAKGFGDISTQLQR